MGCLVRLVGALLVVLALAGLWLYRDRVADEVRGAFGGAPRVIQVGRADANALASGDTKLKALRAGLDSVTLTPAETAALLLDRLPREARTQFEDVRVGLGDDRLVFSARLRTARLPRELLGPFALVVRDVEPVEFAGPLRATRAPNAEWRVDELRLRGVPLPTDLVPILLGRAIGDRRVRSLPLVLPGDARDVRLRPGAMVLYGVARP